MFGRRKTFVKAAGSIRSQRNLCRRRDRRFIRSIPEKLTDCLPMRVKWTVRQA